MSSLTYFHYETAQFFIVQNELKAGTVLSHSEWWEVPPPTGVREPFLISWGSAAPTFREDCRDSGHLGSAERRAANSSEEPGVTAALRLLGLPVLLTLTLLQRLSHQGLWGPGRTWKSGYP